MTIWLYYLVTAPEKIRFWESQLSDKTVYWEFNNNKNEGKNGISQYTPWSQNIVISDTDKDNKTWMVLIWEYSEMYQDMHYLYTESGNKNHLFMCWYGFQLLTYTASAARDCSRIFPYLFPKHQPHKWCPKNENSNHWKSKEIQVSLLSLTI